MKFWTTDHHFVFELTCKMSYIKCILLFTCT